MDLFRELRKTNGFWKSLTEAGGTTFWGLTTGAKWSIALTGISLVAGAIGLWYENEQKKIQQAQESAKEYQDTTKSIEAYREEVESLYKSIDSGTLSTEELYEARSRLNEIDKELKSQYSAGYSEAFSGDYAGLSMLTAGAEEATAAFERLATAQAATYYNENATGIEKAIDKYYNPGEYQVGTWNWDLMTSEQQNQIKQIVSQFDNAILDTFVEDGMTKAVVRINGAAKEIQSTLSALSLAFNGIDFSNVYSGIYGSTTAEFENEYA